jgi:hypothetical protein
MTLGRPAALRQRRNRQSSDQTRRSQLLGQLSAPLRQFLATESGSALLMVSTTVAALMWANSAWSGAYQALWATEGSVVLGDARLEMDLRHWINNGLMAVFFFVIGLEVRRDLSVGELTDRRRVVLPVLAGIGGIVLPALLYLLIAPDGEATRGWGVVIGTDTAFLLGALALVGPATSEVRLADGNWASVGDVIITRRNDRRLRLSGTDWVKNGDRWMITHIAKHGDLIVRHTRSHLTVRLPIDYVRASTGLGYATTIHAAQGVSADTMHGLLTGQESRQQLYTMLTRRQGCESRLPAGLR